MNPAATKKRAKRGVTKKKEVGGNKATSNAKKQVVDLVEGETGSANSALSAEKAIEDSLSIVNNNEGEEVGIRERQSGVLRDRSRLGMIGLKRLPLKP
jgi:hypothetical protein